MDDITVPITDHDNEEHTLHRLKLTVKGARAGKSMGKSLGGNAAAELAEARAKAEAKIAQRNKAEDGEGVPEDEQVVAEVDAATESSVKPSRQLEDTTDKSQNTQKESPPMQVEDPSRRMSLSDLVSESEKSKAGSYMKDKPADLSTSTTPPHSPPTVSNKGPPVAVPPPVFSKPPTVFVAPPPRQPKEAPIAGPSKEPVFKLPAANPFSLPVAATLGIPVGLSTQKSATAVSAQSSKASLFSDAIFDKEDNTPAWMKTTTTQDTEFSQHLPSQKLRDDDDESDMDEDDSWHVDEQVQANQMWTPFGFGSADKDDTMTWSTLPSRSTSQKGGDTGLLTGDPQVESLAQEAHRAASEMLKEEAERIKNAQREEEVGGEDEKKVVQELDSDLDKAQGEIDGVDLPMDDDMEIDEDEPASGVDMELEDIVAAGQPTVGLVKVSDLTSREIFSVVNEGAATASCSEPAVDGFYVFLTIAAWVLRPGESVGQQCLRI